MDYLLQENGFVFIAIIEVLYSIVFIKYISNILHNYVIKTTNNMKNLIKWILLFLTLIGALYLTSSIYLAEFNPTLWSEYARTIFIMWILIIAMAAFIIVEEFS